MCAPTTVPLLAAALAAAWLSPTGDVRAQQPWDQGYEVTRPPVVVPLAKQRAKINAVLTERLDQLLPKLMRECGVTMWIVANREYNEDPVYKTLVPAPVFAARRTTILVFYDRGPEAGVERMTVSRYSLGALYASAWDGGATGSVEEQWRRLGELVAEREPETIAVNSSVDWAVADGLTAGLRQLMMNALGDRRDRVVSAEQLCVRWLETRTGAELEIYPQIVQLARGVIAEAFSSDVITPGVTTTDDVRWWLRQRFQSLGLPVWFHPMCDVQRRTAGADDARPFFGDDDATIRRGDVLHCDVGVRYLRLCTDTQEMGYVLRADERDAPAGLQQALQVGNRWQDLLTTSFVAGRTGNEVLAETLRKCREQNVRGSVYTHPLGFFGHAPGPTIGMWDNQGPTPVRGDWPLHANTCYAIEGNVKVQVPEWDDQWVQIGLEQDACFDGQQVYYLGGRQTRWHLVR